MVHSLNYAQLCPSRPRCCAGESIGFRPQWAISSYLISLSLSIIICEMRAVLSPFLRLLKEKVRECRGHHTAHKNQCSANGDSLSSEQVTSMFINEEQARMQHNAKHNGQCASLLTKALFLTLHCKVSAIHLGLRLNIDANLA